MKWQKFVEWIFYGLLGYFAFSIDSNIKDMSKSIQTLNTQMAVQINENTSVKSKVDDHEGRLRLIESKLK